MSDDLQVRDLVAHLYTAADQIRPDSWSVDTSDPSSVARVLEYLIQHARATEGALRKIGQLMDELRSGPGPKDSDDEGGDGGAVPEARKPGGSGAEEDK
jgi:hypothetical protein